MKYEVYGELRTNPNIKGWYGVGLAGENIAMVFALTQDLANEIAAKLSRPGAEPEPGQPGSSHAWDMPTVSKPENLVAYESPQHQV